MTRRVVFGSTLRGRGFAAALFFALLCVFGVAGCAVDEAGEAPGDSVPRLELVAVIGCDECEDDRRITPTAVALLDGDRVAVLDSWEPFVRIFDAAGDPMVSFGNQGQGPGEFGVSGGSRPIPAAWILGVGDGVGLIDLFPPTLEIFDGEGAFVEQHRLDIPPVPMEQAFNATSRVYLRMGFDPTGGAGPAVHRCVLDLAAGVSCSVAQSLDQIAEAAQQDGAPAADPRAFAIAASPNGDLLLADPLGYRIWAVNEAGEIIMETGRDIPRRAKTEEQIAAERARMPAARADIEIEPLHPHLEYSGLDIDGAGRIWALTTRWTDTDSVFDVFAADGAYLGEAVADALIRRGSGSWAVAPFFLEGNRLASVVQLPDGSEQVRVWRIVEGRP